MNEITDTWCLDLVEAQHTLAIDSDSYTLVRITALIFTTRRDTVSPCNVSFYSTNNHHHQSSSLLT